MGVIREKRLEGVVTKRRDSLYESGRRSGAWVKVRANRAQEFVVAGYVPSPRSLDSILVGHYQGRDLMYAVRVRAGFASASRRLVLKAFAAIETQRCPFRNLPERTRGLWGGGLTASEMEKCIWLKPRLVATIEFLERTTEDGLRHARFVGLHEDKRPKDVVREP